jgi:hypothetical protein
MKTKIKLSVLAAFLLLVSFSSSYAASADYFLKIEGIDGEAKGKSFDLTENSDGSFTVSGIPAGKYKLLYSAKQGKTGMTKRESSTPEVIEFTCEIKSPRDAASGQASGKRTYKPISISKRIDKGAAGVSLGEITVGDLDGDGKGERSSVKSAGYDLKLNKKV